MSMRLQPTAHPALRDPWLFLTEIEHRVANEYALAVASVTLAAARVADPEAKASLAAAAQRLRDYAEVHRALRAPPAGAQADLGASLRELCGALSRASLAERGIRLTLIEESLRIDAERCWRVALIVFELVVNAVRHGLAGRGGAIRVELTRSEGDVRCLVADDGHASADYRPGLGVRLVDALADELGGFVTRDLRAEGARVLLSFPEQGARKSPESWACPPDASPSAARTWDLREWLATP
jgi:two-component sensor histidine kinase